MASKAYRELLATIGVVAGIMEMSRTTFEQFPEIVSNSTNVINQLTDLLEQWPGSSSLTLKDIEENDQMLGKFEKEIFADGELNIISLISHSIDLILELEKKVKDPTRNRWVNNILDELLELHELFDNDGKQYDLYDCGSMFTTLLRMKLK